MFTLDQVAKSFHGVKRGFGLERHSVKSLSKRILTSRQTVRKMLKGGELQFEQLFDAGSNGTSFEFKSAYLDAQRETFVNSIIEEIRARLKGLDMSEQEVVLTALHSLRAHKADIEHQFSKPNSDDDDDPSVTDEVSRLIGATGGGIIGATLGGKIGGGTGLVGGAIGGAAVGSKIGENKTARDVASAAVLGAGAVAAHKAIQDAGGYKAVASSVDKDLETVIDRAGIHASRLKGITKDWREILQNALKKTPK